MKRPWMLVVEEAIGPLKENDLDQISENAGQGSGHPSPITIVEAIMTEMRVLHGTHGFSESM